MPSICFLKSAPQKADNQRRKRGRDESSILIASSELSETARARTSRRRSGPGSGTAHPDRGGDEQAFIQFCSAYKLLIEEIPAVPGARRSPRPATRSRKPTRPEPQKSPRRTRRKNPSPATGPPDRLGQPGSLIWFFPPTSVEMGSPLLLQTPSGSPTWCSLPSRSSSGSRADP